MKKTMIAAAVGAAMLLPLAANANPVLYGKVNVGVVYEDADATSSTWDVRQDVSRLGVKGSEDLGNGLSAIYQYEFGVDASDSGTLSGRLAYAGLAGGFGVVAVGRQTTPYYNTVDKLDVFNMDNTAVSVNQFYLGPVRVGNAVAYVSPTFSGLTVTGALVMAGNGEAEDVFGTDIDIYNLSADYANGPLSAGFSYLATTDKTVDLSQWGLAASYNFGSFAAIAQYENQDAFNATTTSWAVGGEFYMGNNTIRAVYGNVSPDVGSDMANWGLGVEHAFSKRTRVYAEYTSGDDYLSGFQSFTVRNICI